MKTDSRSYVKDFQVAQGDGTEEQEMDSYFSLSNPRDFPVPGGRVAAGWFGTGQVECTHSVMSEIQPALPSCVCVGVQPGKTGP